jgi:hypothetical protein
MTKQIRSVALAVCVGAFFPFLLPVAEAKQQCNAAQPENQHGHWWSYRIIDGRKCWYEGKPGLSKSMLEWPPRVSSAQRSRPHEEVARAMPVESPGKMMDAQAWAPAVADTFEELWRTRVLSTGR